MQQRVQLLEGLEWDQLTINEDTKFEAVMDPMQRKRRYCFGNQEVMNNMFSMQPLSLEKLVCQHIKYLI